jgi:chemotaxis protein CheX
MPEIDYPESGVVGIVELPDVLDLKAAASLAAEFLALRGRAVDIDASHVARLDGQCLQVLLSAVKTWKADETPFALVNPSSNFVEGLARLGVPAAEFSEGERSQ